MGSAAPTGQVGERRKQQQDSKEKSQDYTNSLTRVQGFLDRLLRITRTGRRR